MRQNSFPASEQIETSSPDFLGSPRASCKKKWLKFAIIKGNMQKVMRESSSALLGKRKDPLQDDGCEPFPFWVVFPCEGCRSPGWEATFSSVLFPGIIWQSCLQMQLFLQLFLYVASPVCGEGLTYYRNKGEKENNKRNEKAVTSLR